MFSKTRHHLRCKLLFGLIGQFGLVKGVNIYSFHSRGCIFHILKARIHLGFVSKEITHDNILVKYCTTKWTTLGGVKPIMFICTHRLIWLPDKYRNNRKAGFCFWSVNKRGKPRTEARTVKRLNYEYRKYYFALFLLSHFPSRLQRWRATRKSAKMQNVNARLVSTVCVCQKMLLA